MVIDVNSFFDLVRSKNGLTKIRRNSTKEANIYNLLRDLGFRVCALDGKRSYYRRLGGEIIPIRIHDIRTAFIEFLKGGELSNVPAEINYQSIMNWYYSANPVKENTNFLKCLRETLSDTELHNYLLNSDGNYKSNFELQELLSKFDEWGFAQVTDNISSYSSNTPPLYYKQIDKGKFIVFNHWNANSKHTTSGFDSWVAIYKDKKHIGLKRPYEQREIRLGFQLERDFKLIETTLVMAREVKLA